MTIPNALTLLRLCLIPLIVVLIQDRNFSLAFAVFLLAGLTDAVDGFIARRFNMQSAVGAYLDASPTNPSLPRASSRFSQRGLALLAGRAGDLPRPDDRRRSGHRLASRQPDSDRALARLEVQHRRTDRRGGLHARRRELLVAAPGAHQIVYLVVALLTVVSVGAYFVKWFRHIGRVTQGSGPAR